MWGQQRPHAGWRATPRWFSGVVHLTRRVRGGGGRGVAFMRSANEPVMRAHVMTAKVHWNIMKTLSGIVPLIEAGRSGDWLSTPMSQKRSEPPTKGFSPLPNASEYPIMNQSIEMRQVIANDCITVLSTFSARVMPP